MNAALEPPSAVPTLKGLAIPFLFGDKCNCYWRKSDDETSLSAAAASGTAGDSVAIFIGDIASVTF